MARVAATEAVNFSGVPLDYVRPNPAHIDIVDIGLGISKECRWNGQLPPDEFYSVAQHSVLVSNLLPAEAQFPGLMHDAEEAYVRDLATPLKLLIPQYVEVANGVKKALRIRFDLHHDDTDSRVKEVDTAVAKIEHEALFEHRRHFPLLSPGDAFRAFIARFNELYPIHLERLRQRGIDTYHDTTLSRVQGQSALLLPDAHQDRFPRPRH